jgi:hypothetical protein
MTTDRSDGFSVFKTDLEGYPLIAFVDVAPRSLELREKTPWFLSVSTPITSPTLQGLPSAEEADALNSWEERIERELASVCRLIFVGRVTWNGNRELLYYVDSATQVASVLDDIAHSDTSRPFAFRCERDDEWTEVEVYLSS